MLLYTYLSAAISLIVLMATRAHAAMNPSDIQSTCNALAASAFGLKDLVLAINSTSNVGPMQDVFGEFHDLFDSVLADVGLMTGSATLTQATDQQTVYEAFSNFVQGLLELMDALSGSASTFIKLDEQSEFRIPTEVRALGGVVDAYFFNLIGLFPASSAYYAQSNNQKGQVDTHFRQAVHSFHLATALTPQPYSNISST